MINILINISFLQYFWLALKPKEDETEYSTFHQLFQLFLEAEKDTIRKQAITTIPILIQQTSIRRFTELIRPSFDALTIIFGIMKN